MSFRCVDDLILDRQRVAVRKRLLDDIRLDRKRLRRTDADADSFARAQTAPTSQDVVIPHQGIESKA